jgi:hypothetical protein
MCAQVEVKAEAFIADVALIRFFACVNELVTLKLAIVKKLLAASFNHTPEHSFSMCHFVFSVSRMVRKHFKAVLQIADVLTLLITLFV